MTQLKEGTKYDGEMEEQEEMNIKDLIKEAHETAVEKGWWDKPVDFGSQIANIHAELSEAWEDYRNNREWDEIYWECTENDIDCSSKLKNGKCINSYCQYAKPCGIPIELADVVIRIFDTFGYYQVDIDDIQPYYLGKGYGDIVWLINIGHGYLYQQEKLGCATSFKYLYGLINEIVEFCNENRIDIEKAIELKMAYNRTRSYRHGGKKA